MTRRGRWWVAVSVGVVLLTVALPLGIRNGTFTRDPSSLLSVLIVAVYVGFGALLAGRVPENPIGWLLLVIGMGVLGGAASEYATYSLQTSPGSLPFGTAAAWINSWSFIAAGAIPLLLVLFPTGRVPSPRWRWVPTTIVASTLGLVLITMFRTGVIDVTTTLRVDNPLGIPALRPLFDVLVWPIGLALLTGSIASAVAVIQRFRGAVGEEKQQLRWLAVAAGLAGISLAAVLATGIGLGQGETRPANELAFFVFFVCLAVGIPGAVGVALLKYRLYELDIVIKKTALYVTVAGLLIAVFLAVAVVIGGVFGRSEGAAVVAAAIIGLAFWPALRVARRVADRIVYGGRATPYELLASFGERMSETYATDDVLPRTAHLLADATGASKATVWLRVGRQLRPAAWWPADGDPPKALALDRGELPALAADRSEAVRDRGELLGALAVDMPANDPIDATRGRLLRDVAAQTGLVLRNVRLIEELRESRRRIVAAQDARAKQLERNIHDGAQQQLVALAVQLRLAEQFTERDPGKAKSLLARLQSQANSALEDLRDLARGIYPPLLADKGLRAAIEAQANKAAVPVTVEVDGIGRYPPDVEATVYFSTLEALANVAKYAAASAATVRLRQENGSLRFTVSDDGRGFDPSATTYGTGLQGIEDRLAALGGELSVRSAAGEGTTVDGRLPV